MEAISRCSYVVTGRNGNPTERFVLSMEARDQVDKRFERLKCMARTALQQLWAKRAQARLRSRQRLGVGFTLQCRAGQTAEDLKVHTQVDKSLPAKALAYLSNGDQVALQQYISTSSRASS